MALTDQQRVAVDARGEVVVAAGAGTGKTTLVVERVRAALELGTAPERVLVVTYTDAAARELGLRLERALPAVAGGSRPQVGTIHALAARLLREYASEAGLPVEMRVLDEAEALVLFEAAFGDAIARDRREGDSAVLDLLGEYGVEGARALIRSLDARLRAAGVPVPILPPARLAQPALLAPLREAALAATAALSGDARSQAATDLRRLARIERVLAEGPGNRELLALDAPRSETAAQVSELLATAQEEARARLEHEVGAAVATLLDRHREAYRARKEAELALDFDDLQERACELLERPGVGAEVRDRFDLVLVDEFQDTNRLQCRLLDALAGAASQRVFVGDACQSIYRFRYADVELFRVRAERASVRLPLTGSYRSRPELLAVIGHVFGQRFDEREFEPPHALRVVEPVTEPAIELHLVAGGEGSARAGAAREVEATALARRLRELVDGGVSPGDIAVLLRSARDASTYAGALERVGLVARSQLGRGFYRSQQVRDLCAYLALLRNRFDDHALLVVLASPLVGASNDGLSALREAAQRALYWPIELGQLGGFPERDRMLVDRFKELYEGLVRASGELGLAALLERIVSVHDYDLACLTAADGERRFGNVRKLTRAARDYERDHGPDLAGFVELMRLCDARDLSEADAPPGGGEEAVALMTIHAAKGLEFAVVCVPDLSRPTPAEGGAVAVGPDGEVGLRLRDARGRSVDGPVYARLAAAAKAAEEAEGDRVAYVAWTRARDRLLLGGWLGERRGELRRVLDQLGIVGAALDPGVALADVAGAHVRVHVHTAEDVQAAAVTPPPADDPEPGPQGQLSLFDAAELSTQPAARPAAPRPLEPLPAPELHVPRSLSYSALALHDRCGFAYYAERVVGLRRPPAPPGPLRGALLGDAVHRAVAVGVDRACGDLDAGDRATVEGLVAAWERSSLSARMRAAGPIAHELPFAFSEQGVVLRGSLDMCVRDAAGALLVADIKTTALGAREPEAVAETDYALQRAIYALAALRTGAPEAEVAFCFLERPEDDVVRRYTQSDAGWLAGEVAAAIGRLRSSRFAARAGAHCASCPALDRICPAPGWRERESP
ncbi:MAG TPA: UvrD-helicase domain-containing protein [Solirubrobacteraceae bacterium]|nr:UvrD-helicase domain-containing protein [Solirubrobacteraceae bacterium]